MPLRSDGMDVVRLRGQTQLVHNAPLNDNTATLLSEMNPDAVLNSLMFDRATGTIMSECSMYGHPQNLQETQWVQPVPRR